MNVFCKFLGAGMANIKGKFDLPEGATLDTLLQKCAGDGRFTVGYEGLKTANFLVNNHLATLDTVLREGDEVLILRPLGGG